MTDLVDPVLQVYLDQMRSPEIFTLVNCKLRLRRYQIVVARAVLDSINHHQGLGFVVMFPRQSGKNEVQAQLETYLLAVLCCSGAEIIKISPTWKPQSLNAMNRLETILKEGFITHKLWQKDSGYIYRIERARISFLSGEPTSHIVGATAGTLLEVDEAQDVQIAKYDKEIAPMAASTNATRVFWGTAWTSQTLLARELQIAARLQAEDGVQRVFRITADDVACEVPPYDAFVREQIARLGRMHPMVRTQFFSEEIDGETGMFPPERRARMLGDHPPQSQPLPGRPYAFLLDVGGESAAAGRSAGEDAEAVSGREHDSTALTVVEIDLAGYADPVLQAPIYRVVKRMSWRGVGQPELFGQMKTLIEQWKPRRVVVDATGIGAGLAAFLQKIQPARVRPFIFTTVSKSNLGWEFLALCDTGRFLDHQPVEGDRDQQDFWRQAAACQMEADGGAGCRIHWGVPDGARDPATHRPIHDDLLLSASLCALLDHEKWRKPATSGSIIQARDPLDDFKIDF